jgi:hypothetical protein
MPLKFRRSSAEDLLAVQVEELRLRCEDLQRRLDASTLLHRQDLEAWDRERRDLHETIFVKTATAYVRYAEDGRRVEEAPVASIRRLSHAQLAGKLARESALVAAEKRSARKQQRRTTR